MSTETAHATSPTPRPVDVNKLSENRRNLAALGAVLFGLYVIGGAVLTAYSIALLIDALDSRNPMMQPVVAGTYLAGGLALILTGFILQALCIWLSDAQELLESMQSNLYLITDRVLGQDQQAAARSEHER